MVDVVVAVFGFDGLFCLCLCRCCGCRGAEVGAFDDDVEDDDDDDVFVTLPFAEPLADGFFRWLEEEDC